MKNIARMMGLSIPDDFALEHEEVLPFKQRILDEAVKPFPVEPMKSLLRELPDKKKRMMASYMKWPIRSQPKKPFPDAVMFKYLRADLQQQEGRQKVMVAVLLAVMDLYDEAEEVSAEAFLDAQYEKIRHHGYWQYYWALRLYPDNTEGVEKRLQELEAGDVRFPEDGSVENAEERPAVQDKQSAGDMGKPIAALKRKLERESELRRQAEKEINILLDRLRRQDKLVEQQSAERSGLERELASAAERTARGQAALDEERKRNETLLNDKRRLQVQIRTLENELAGLQAKADAAERDLKMSRLRFANERNRQSEPKELAGKLLDCLHAESEQLCQSLSDNKGSGFELRRKIRSLFDIIDLLEEYRQQIKGTIPTAKLHAAAVAASEPPAPAAAEPPAPAAEETEVWVHGTFYRRDHGGYIILEHGETFNITESMVHHHNLQHEAEVQCRPGRQENGTILYDIELLLQGDDSFSPIRQFDGYIELGEHFTWYCVDINNSSNRYPLHYKDVEMQQPADGDACLFNVAVGGRIARLSRLYRERTKETSWKDKANPVKPFVSPEEKPKIKPEPYLAGCRIAIVGGQQKWFESVVTETGAELVHDKGENPERIHADLRRADALFMLLTATSHRATWSCVEIAKQHRIPHFVIQGSKSNLRTLLWDNRETITGSRKNGND